MSPTPNVSILWGIERQVPRDVRLHRLFERNAHHPAHAARTALIYQDDARDECVRLSYLQLDEAATRMARAILRTVHKNGSPCNTDGDVIVAVSIPPSDTLIVALLAVWKAGAAYLPLDTHAPPKRIQHILSEARPILVIDHRADCNENEVYKNVHVVSTQYLLSIAAENSSNVIEGSEMLKAVNESSVAVVPYTSGSTGLPKGVRIPHRAIYNRILWEWNTFPYSRSEGVCAFKTALTFVDSVCEIWAPLLGENPKSILVIPKEVTMDPERLVATLEEHHVERLILVPSLLRAILLHLDKNRARRDHQRLKGLKLWICSGEPLVPSLIRHFFNHFESTRHVVCNFYGSTEVMDVTFERLTCCVGDVVPIGTPVDNYAIYVLDSKLNPVPCGQIGEIYCAGLNVAAGYVSNRDADRFIRNPYTQEPDYSVMYRTGDFGKISNGVLLYEGRTDSQIKVRGHRVDLSEIENSLYEINGIGKVVVVCYRPREINQAIFAFVTLQDHSWSSSSLRDELKKTLPLYSMPQIKILEKIPLLNNGKPDRQLLLQRVEENNNASEKIPIDLTGVPQDKLKAAKCLFETVGFILGSWRGTINKDVGFYELGGNSLNSIYTINKLRDQGFVIGITDLISSETLGDIVEKLRSEDDCNSQLCDGNTLGQKYETEILKDSHREALVEIINDSFCKKGDLEQSMNPRLEIGAHSRFINALWAHLVSTRLSFVVKSKETGRLVGGSLNFDLHDEPLVEVTGRFNIILEFLESLEGPIRDTQLPQGKGRILHTFMMGTHPDLTAQQNVELIQFMEEECVRLAKRRGFTSIFTTNSSPLTQQLDSDVFDYQVLLTYQINTYVAPDGSRPFCLAPDDQVVVCSLKHI